MTKPIGPEVCSQYSWNSGLHLCFSYLKSFIPKKKSVEFCPFLPGENNNNNNNNNNNTPNSSSTDLQHLAGAGSGRPGDEADCYLPYDSLDNELVKLYIYRQFPQVGLKIKNIWSHHLVFMFKSMCLSTASYPIFLKNKMERSEKNKCGLKWHTKKNDI